MGKKVIEIQTHFDDMSGRTTNWSGTIRKYTLGHDSLHSGVYTSHGKTKSELLKFISKHA